MQCLRDVLDPYFSQYTDNDSRVYIKRSQNDTALLTVLAPGEKGLTESVRQRLIDDGFSVKGETIWFIDPPIHFYRKPFTKEVPACSADPMKWCAYTLYRFIMTHPYQEEDPYYARKLIKAIDAGVYEAAVTEITCMQTKKARRGELLDGLLLPWLHMLLTQSPREDNV